MLFLMQSYVHLIRGGDIVEVGNAQYITTKPQREPDRYFNEDEEAALIAWFLDGYG